MPGRPALHPALSEDPSRALAAPEARALSWGLLSTRQAGGPPVDLGRLGVQVDPRSRRLGVRATIRAHWQDTGWPQLVGPPPGTSPVSESESDPTPA